MRNVLRWLGEVMNPTRTARAVPLGRVSILIAFVTATIFVLYSLAKDRFAIPVVSERYTIQAEFPDAAGLDPANEPPVAVAGVPSGKVVGAKYEDGRAVVTLELDEEVRGKVFRDASVRARPLNAANILTVNVTPGTPRAGPMPEGGTIRAERSSIPVASDEFLGMLDADTRAYLRVVVGESATALRGRGGDLGAMMRAAGPLSDSARPLARMLAERRRLVRELVGDFDRILRTTARRRSELAAAVDAGTRILETSGAHEADLAAAMRQLPTLLAEIRGAFAAVRRADLPVELALDRLRPAARAFVPALRATRKLTPAIDRLLDSAEVLGERGRGPDRDLRGFLAGLRRNTAPLEAGLAKLTNLVGGLDRRKEGLRRTADVLSGATSTQDNHGPIVRFKLAAAEPLRPADLGFGSYAAQRNGRAHSQLELMLARALDGTCREDGGLACILRFTVPGLPGSLRGRDGKVHLP